MQNAKSKPLTCKSSPLVETTYADLYEDLQDFRIDESNDTAFSFTDRLARDNGWAVEYSKRVVDEYKKFMLLAVAAGHPVTPSDQVDQAWHLHLTYSRSYWQDLCNGVLRKDIHHGPTQGGAKEAIKFDHWYRNTLNTYSRFFGCPPPKDIWPDPHIRFGEDLHFRRVNTKQYWVFPRLRLLGSWRAWLFLLLIGTAIVLSYSVGMAQDTDGNGSNGDSRWVLLVTAAIIFLFFFFVDFIPRWCSNCKKSYALHKTSEKRIDKGLLIEKGLISKETLWECKYCKYQVWRKKGKSFSGGCGGCGGA